MVEEHDIERMRSAFLNATKTEKEAALKDATVVIDKMVTFRGEPKTKLQALSWPRKNAFYDDGTPILGVPEAVQNATSQLAMFMVSHVPLNERTVAIILAILDPVIEPVKLN